MKENQPNSEWLHKFIIIFNVSLIFFMYNTVTKRKEEQRDNEKKISDNPYRTYIIICTADGCGTAGRLNSLSHPREASTRREEELQAEIDALQQESMS